MTRMLASVANPEEARSLLSVGVDILDIKDPRKGALGAVEAPLVEEIVRLVAGHTMTSATIGDLPLQASCIAEGIEKMQDSGVDIIKVGVFAKDLPDKILRVVEEHAGSGTRIVLVFFADLHPALHDMSRLSAGGVHGVMLDTADKTNGSLRTIMNEHALRSFVNSARAHGLISGLAGSLQARDITPLLEMKPDYLGFRGALCNSGQRKMSIDIHAAREVRALIPHHYPSLVTGEGKGAGWIGNHHTPIPTPVAGTEQASP